MSKEEKKSGLATAAMVLGIIAIVGSWIPFVNIVSIILGVLAFIFGIIPLLKKKSTGKAVTGVVLGALAVIIGIYMTSAATESIDDAINSDTEVVGSAESDSEKTTYKVGDVIKFDDKQVTVTDLQRNWNSGNEYSQPDSGNEFVNVKVSIENNSDGQISYNTFDWKIKNSDGMITDVDMETYGLDGSLESGELAPGGKVSGTLVFQAPSGDEGLALQYSPSFWTDKKLEIKL